MTPDDASAKTCCAPRRGSDAVAAPPALERMLGADEFDTVAVPGGTALVGTRDPQIPDDGESPLRKVHRRPFRMGATVVTYAEFAKFVAQTGLFAEAGRFGWSFVLWSHVAEAVGPPDAIETLRWWRRVDGAFWPRHPARPRPSRRHRARPILRATPPRALQYVRQRAGVDGRPVPHPLAQETRPRAAG